MRKTRWCRVCQDYVPNIRDHIKQHSIGQNSDAIERKQYTGFSSDKKEDYMVCLLHQKKVPCPIKDCHYKPFGMLKKSLLMSYIKNGEILWHDRYGNQIPPVPIDFETKTVILFGATIHLRF